jgi:hypothetical protein
MWLRNYRASEKCLVQRSVRTVLDRDDARWIILILMMFWEKSARRIRRHRHVLFTLLYIPRHGRQAFPRRVDQDVQQPYSSSGSAYM